MNGGTVHARVNLGLLVVWAVLGIPTMLWWKDSVPWVSFMSWYAIVVSHAAAYIAAKAEQQAES